MKLQIKPVYGWGWFDTEDVLLDVPPAFLLEAEIIVDGQPFVVALGYMDEAGHALNGAWLVFLLRGKYGDTCVYNLLAFKQKPDKKDLADFKKAIPQVPMITGFADIKELSAQ